MSEISARRWVLDGGGGFESTPEAVSYTFEGLVRMLEDYGEYKDERHNAALAAAVEQAVPHPAELITKMAKLEQQLAAAGFEQVRRFAEIQQLREQLAAAVEALKRCRQAFIVLQDPQHTNQIDAALEKIGKL